MPVLSPKAKVDINGLPFGSISGNYRVSRDMVPATSTEDSSSMVEASPIRKITMQSMAQLDPELVYHGSGYDLFNIDGIAVRIWHNGRDDPTNVTDIPCLKLSEEARDWNMQGSAAQGVNLTGESHGDFWLPGEV